MPIIILYDCIFVLQSDLKLCWFYNWLASYHFYNGLHGFEIGNMIYEFEALDIETSTMTQYTIEYMHR